MTTDSEMAAEPALKTDRTLPFWLRLPIVVMALSQAFFGLTLLANPAAISALWPWTLTAASARLLGASALVSVPLMLLSAYANRFRAARLPLVMLLTYRVMQILAGLLHLDRFNFGHFATWNYFGGGGIILALIAVALYRGRQLGTPADDGPAWLGGQAPLDLARPLALGLQATAVVFWALAAIFLVLGGGAGWLWFEKAGSLTPLTARLFASPALGLGFAAWIIGRGVRRREAVIPAVGMATFGLTGLTAFALGWPDVQPSSALGYVVPATPLLLLMLGVAVLGSGRRP